MDRLPTTKPQPSLSENQFQFPGNLGALLDCSADLYPNRTGIAVPGRSSTFKDYYDRVCRMVHGLQKIGLNRNDRVLLMASNSLNYAFISLAVFRIGAVLVPVNHRMRHHELTHIISETHPKFLICERRRFPTILKAYESIQGTSTPCFITIDEKAPSTLFIEDLDPSEAQTHCEDMSAEETAMIIYTAAMEGYSLGAQLTHASLFYDAAYFAQAAFKHGDPGNEVLSAILPLFHSYGFTCGFLVPLTGGVTCLLLDTSTGRRRTVESLESHQVTQIISVPAIFWTLVKPLSEKPHVCSRFRNLTSGGIQMPMELLETYRDQLGLVISEGYGLTETSPVVTWNQLECPPKFGTVGYPLACCEVRIVDDSGKELSPGQEGEVLVRGLNVFSGYLNQPSLTQKAFANGWFKTGDLGYLDSEHYLTLTGLKKDMINILGLKVFPKEVIRILSYHPSIQTARIWGEWDEKFGEIVAGEIFLKPGHVMSEKEFWGWCRQNISPHKIPRKIKINHCAKGSNLHSDKHQKRDIRK